ncbi:MAG TPA: hypothetical protein VMJ10_05030 [Kofleriaceae bacterium]|nr:hypothetical protein [Kofleriaceae bacterium]
MSRPRGVGWLFVLAACDRVLGLTTVGPLPDAPMLAPGTWAEVALGGTHGCGIRLDGSLWCWGDGASGQLGLGPDVLATAMPTRVGTATWKHVSAGLAATCAIDTGDALWCWGANDDAQLGDGSTTNRTSPVSVGSGHWSAIALGDQHACALDAAGGLWCWGDNSYEELGQSDLAQRTTPTMVPSTLPWTNVTSGPGFSCAVRSDHTAWCWGSDSYGQLGIGMYVAYVPPTMVDSEAWSVISAGGTHACGLLTDGHLRCWGSNTYGELGLEQVGSSGTPAASGDPTMTWTSVATGAQHTCATSAAGELWCWGSNSVGQIGIAMTSQYNPEPHTVVGGATTWATVAAGGEQTCGLGADHNLWCFGRGTTSVSSVTTPTQVAGTWSAISVGQTTACAIASDASLWCWGANYSGEVGDGTYANRATPTRIADPSWTALSVGASYACALRSDGSAFCWGAGPIGDGSSQRALPTLVVGGPYAAISVGDEHACAIEASSGFLQCWGQNSSGQLGTGDTMAYYVPQTIGMATWTEVSAGFDHTCGVSGASLLCWGDNSFGELGTGTFVSQMSPFPIGSAATPSSGLYDTCAVGGGALACWGSNVFGEDGIGSSTAAISPTLITGTWNEVGIAYQHACAIASDHTLWCWGSNGYGQVGQASLLANYLSPMQVDTGTAWQHVGVGWQSSCATKTDGSLWCWGDNSSGELGIGVSASSGPVLVP